jgi:hypothetical protein
MPNGIAVTTNLNDKVKFQRKALILRAPKMDKKYISNGLFNIIQP